MASAASHDVDQKSNNSNNKYRVDPADKLEVPEVPVIKEELK